MHRETFATGEDVERAAKTPQVKPRRADCTARESVWECRSLPALNKGQSWKHGWPFPLGAIIPVRNLWPEQQIDFGFVA
jgi:hypothetical protein